MESIIGYILGFAVISLIVIYLNKKSETKLQPDEKGQIVLRHSNIYQVIGFSFLIFPALCWFLAFTFKQVLTSDDLMGLFLISAVFLVLAIPLIYISWQFRLWVDDDKMEYRSLFRSTKVMFWNNIINISVNPSLQTLSIKDKNEEIKVDIHTIGFKNLLNMIKEKVEPSLWEKELNEIKGAKNRFNLFK